MIRGVSQNNEINEDIINKCTSFGIIQEITDVLEVIIEGCDNTSGWRLKSMLVYKLCSQSGWFVRLELEEVDFRPAGLVARDTGARGLEISI